MGIIFVPTFRTHLSYLEREQIILPRVVKINEMFIQINTSLKLHDALHQLDTTPSKVIHIFHSSDMTEDNAITTLLAGFETGV